MNKCTTQYQMSNTNHREAHCVCCWEWNIPITKQKSIAVIEDERKSTKIEDKIYRGKKT